MPTPVRVGRFVIRATRERGVGAPSSRSLATASHEALLRLARRTDRFGERRCRSDQPQSNTPESRSDAGTGSRSEDGLARNDDGVPEMARGPQSDTSA